MSRGRSNPRGRNGELLVRQGGNDSAWAKGCPPMLGKKDDKGLPKLTAS